MGSTSDFFSQLVVIFGNFIDALAIQLPGIFGALLLLFAGWLLARLARYVSIRALNWINHFLERVLTGQARAVIRLSTGITHLLAGMLFWATWFVFLVLALRTAGLEEVAGWLERIVVYLPALFTSVLIIIAGYIASGVVRDVVYTTARSTELAEAELLSKLARAITLITAMIIALDQAGVDITFLTIMLSITAGTVLAGFALAFGLGAKALVSNLIAAHHLRNEIEMGQRVRIGDYEGSVLDISATTIVLNTAEGRTSIPAKLYQEQAVSILLEELDNG